MVNHSRHLSLYLLAEIAYLKTEIFQLAFPGYIGYKLSGFNPI
ncbi:hypothetical protein [Nodularia spumigena]|nr:hypothetical protein [Nodularia spumigena]